MKKTFVIGEELLNAICANLLEQPAKLSIQLLDALRATVAEQSKKVEVVQAVDENAKS